MGRSQWDVAILILSFDADVTHQGQGQGQKNFVFSKFETAE